ncbi:MAG: hypothetical protein K6F71_07680 [Ruminococcus sp.]|uniref:hypothetical protein n=1 Tax=Ruminococcus sp. TaxID=41978 RepID=UPI0025FF2730|nr:hypothetical protein [Ruminococcus sp.]MCR5540682.1 hypothetical protein [Ruminococcus sp.]
MSDNSGVKKYIIPCPRCNKIHRIDGDIVDEIIHCSCGFEFYAFAVGDFRIVMSKTEACSEPIVRSMRRFVVSTGRCPDIPPELYDDVYNDDFLEMEESLAKSLEEHQLESFGNVYFTKDLLDSICESFSNGKDVELKKKKDSIDIIELKKKNISRKRPDATAKRICSVQDINDLISGNGALVFRAVSQQKNT